MNLRFVIWNFEPAAIALRAMVCYSRIVMTQKSQKIIKTGNSAAVTVPSEMLKSLNLQTGDRAEAKMNFAEGSITYIFPEIRQLRLDEVRKNKKWAGSKKFLGE